MQQRPTPTDVNAVGEPLEQARVAVEEGRVQDALDLVAEAWRVSRSARLAEIARRLSLRRPSPLSEQLAAIVHGSADASLKRLVALRGVDHPLVANFVLEQLLVPAFVGGSAPPWIDELISLGLALRDPRLRAEAERIGYVLTERMKVERSWRPLMARLVNGVIDAIPAPNPLTTPSFRTWQRLDRAPAHPSTLALEAALRASVDVDTLLDDIAARPDDDAPRLRLAALLVARGDPRGEFIQLQCGGRDPAREQALLKKHGKRWLGMLASSVDIAACRYERGFLAHVVLTGFATFTYINPCWRDPLWDTVETITSNIGGTLRVNVPESLLWDAPLNALRRVDLGVTAVTRLVAVGRQLASVQDVELTGFLDWSTTARELGVLCPKLKTLRTSMHQAAGVKNALQMIAEPIPTLDRLILRAPFSSPSEDALWLELLAGVAATPATYPEVVIARRVDHRPPPTALVFRRVEDRYAAPVIDTLSNRDETS